MACLRASACMLGVPGLDLFLISVQTAAVEQEPVRLCGPCCPRSRGLLGKGLAIPACRPPILLNMHQGCIWRRPVSCNAEIAHMHAA